MALLDYTVQAASPAPPTGGGNVVPGPYSQAIIGPGSAPVGTAPIGGVHNTSLHIAAWGLGSLGLVVLMHKWGFHLLSVGRYGGGR